MKFDLFNNKKEYKNKEEIAKVISESFLRNFDGFYQDLYKYMKQKNKNHNKYKKG